jgi:hypothetical protein
VGVQQFLELCNEEMLGWKKEKKDVGEGKKKKERKNRPY